MRTLQHECILHTLPVEKIPVVLRPIIKMSVKSMASLGTQEFRIFIYFDERLVRNSR